jgi:hypothetical protein
MFLLIAIHSGFVARDGSAGDPPMLPALLAQIPSHKLLARVSTDGAYDTKGCHAAIAQRSAQAVISPQKNGKP